MKNRIIKAVAVLLACGLFGLQIALQWSFSSLSNDVGLLVEQVARISGEQPLGGITRVAIGTQTKWTTDLIPSASFTVNLGSSALRVNNYFGTAGSISTGFEIGTLASVSGDVNFNNLVDWSDINNSMTLDANTTIASGSALSLTVAATIKEWFGTATSPSYSFKNDSNTGMYRSGADQLAFTTGGTQRMNLDSGNLVSTVPHEGPNGTTANATYGFTNEPSTGMYLSSAGILGFSTGGSNRLSIDINGATFASDVTAGATKMEGSGPSVLVPNFSFTNDTNTGIYNAAADTIGFGSNATRIGSASLGAGWELVGAASVSSNLIINGTGSSSFAGSLLITKGISAAAAIVGDIIRAASQFFFPATTTNNTLDPYHTSQKAVINTASVSLNFGAGDANRGHALSPLRCVSSQISGTDLTAKNQWTLLTADEPYRIKFVQVTASGSNSATWNLLTGSATVPVTDVFTLGKQASGSGIVRYTAPGGFFATASVSDGHKLDIRVTSTSANLESVYVRTCLEFDNTN